MTSYIILGRPDEALLPFVTNTFEFFFKQRKISNLGSKNPSEKPRYLFQDKVVATENKACIT